MAAWNMARLVSLTATTKGNTWVREPGFRASTLLLLKEQIVAGDVTSEDPMGCKWLVRTSNCARSTILLVHAHPVGGRYRVGCLRDLLARPRIPGSTEARLIEQTTNLAIWRLSGSDRKMRRSRAFLARGQRLNRSGATAGESPRGDSGRRTYRIYEYDTSIKPVIPMVYRRVHPEDLHLMERIVQRASMEERL